MSFRMPPIYPHRVYVSRPERSMTEAQHTDMVGTKSCDGGHHEHAGRHHGHGARGAAARDPVCGMSVDPTTSKHRFDTRGETFHFCSAGCRTKFAADPQKYLDNSKPKAAAPEGTIYTCPMHPQIRKVGPGSCPICGMALEPEVASLDAPPNAELADMTRRLWIGGALALPAVVLEMRGREATSGAIKALLQLAPRTARLVDADGVDHEVEIDSLKAGDHLRVR